jgi:hypothetical protein
MTPHRSLHGFAGTSLVASILLVLGGAASAQCPIPLDEFEPDSEFTSSFMRERCRFSTNGDNPFFPLRPGWRTVLESDEEKAVITVLNKTERVNGVRTRVVEELAYEMDEGEWRLTERSLNYFAICRQTGSVFYFGEDGEDYDEDGNVIGNAGAWRDGVNGAMAGIIMPGTALVGGGYYEEIAPEDSALDKARIVSLEDGCEIGEFEFDGQCLETENSQDCSDDEEGKLYVEGIGQVVDEDMELTDFGFVRRGRRGHGHDD